ncbi:hypothetical protein AB5N19_04829 [Seiridium cardinale]
MKRFGPANHWLELQYDENTPTPTASSPWDSNLAPSSSKGKPPGHCAAALMQTGGLGLGDQQGLTPTQVVPTTGQYILRAANQGGCGSALECEFEGEFEHPAAAIGHDGTEAVAPLSGGEAPGQIAAREWLQHSSAMPN